MTAALLGLPDEGRDALMRAALEAPEEALEGWRRWQAPGTNPWTDPVAWRWLPLVGWNLRDSPLDERSAHALRGMRRAVWAANVGLWTAAAPALDALAAAGIPTMVLKGAAIAFTVFDAPGVRPLGDIDVLVEPDRADAAQVVLNGLGWTASRSARPSELITLHGLDFQNGRNGLLDLHWYLLHECCWAGADAGVWRRAIPIVVEGRTTLVPGPADALWHACVHGLRWSPVHSAHWVADAVWIIRRAGPDLDWDALVDEVVRRGLAHQMHEALVLLRDRWDAAVPDEVVRRLEGQGASLFDRLECRVKGRPRASFGGLFMIWRNWRRIARAPARPPFLRYLALTVGEDSLWRLLRFGGRHLAVRVFAPWRRPRGTSSAARARVR